MICRVQATPPTEPLTLANVGDHAAVFTVRPGHVEIVNSLFSLSAQRFGEKHRVAVVMRARGVGAGAPVPKIELRRWCESVIAMLEEATA